MDTDEQTEVGFAYQSRWLFGDDGGKSRTFDMSVPETDTNNKVFGFHEMPVMAGVRQSIDAVVICDGVNIEGKMFVSQWSGGRYSLLFIYGAVFDGFTSNTAWIFNDQLVYSDKEVPLSRGLVPNFGWYQYDNGATNGITGDPPTVYPVCNLGYIINGMASACGYSVRYPAVPLGRRYQAEAYGFILPTMDTYAEAGIDITGSGVAGWSYNVSGVATLAEAGLTIATKRYKRGIFNENKTVYVFQAIRPIKVTMDSPSPSVVVCGGEGYDILNTWYGDSGFSLDMETGDWFTFAHPLDWSRTFGRERWHGSLTSPHGYETPVSATFRTYDNAGIPSIGSNIDLMLNLPNMSLTEYLNAYCRLICAYWEVDESTSTITIRPLDAAIGQLAKWLDLDNERLVSIGAVRRYVDGWSQHNLLRCKTADGVPEYSWFRRDYQVSNDYLDEERQIAEIPFNEGAWSLNQWGQKALFCDDVTQCPNGEMSYCGVLTLFYENADHEGALHLQTVNDEGLGVTFGDFVRNANTVEVSVMLSLRRFLEMKETNAVTLRGATYVVESAQWGNGVAKLKLLSVNI